MGWHEAVINIVHREVQRAFHRNTRRTPVVVSAYDKQTYAAKFKLMPDSADQPVETGWIPLGTGKSAIAQQSNGGGGGGGGGGNQQPYGWHMPPEVGEHGWLDFHESDREAATYTASTYNDKIPPVPTEAGELQYISPWGHTIYCKQDGSITIKNGNQQQTAAQQTGSGGGSSKKQAFQSTITIDNQGTITITTSGGTGDVNVQAHGNINHTAGNGKTITFTADKIVHAGTVYLGGADASRAASLHGSVDIAGHASVSNLATKVFAK